MLQAADHLGRTLRVAESPAALLDAIGMEIAESAHRAIAARGSFHAAFAARSVAPALGSALMEQADSLHACWPRIHLFAADASWDPRLTGLLARLPLPRENLHRPTTFTDSPGEAAVRYEQHLRAHFRLAPGELPDFDLILLDLGADGRLGGLPPGASLLSETNRLVASDFVAGRHQLSLTPPVINRARRIVVLASGAQSAAALNQALSAAAGIPSQLIAPARSRVLFLADHGAAATLALALADDGTVSPRRAGNTR